MANILISTIMRDSSYFVPKYYEYIKQLVHTYSEHKFFVSIYENDSKDNTIPLLKGCNWSFLEDRIAIQSESLKTKKYGSVMDATRVENLGKARMKSIYVNDKSFLDQSDFVLSLESDVEYPIDSLGKLLKFGKTNGIKNVDIVSGMCLKNRKDGTINIRDTWATRLTAQAPPNPTHGLLRGDWKISSYGKYYSTFSGFCLYKAEVIRKGASFSGFNERLNTFDCDTAVICEDFHKLGYSDIYIDYTVRGKHWKR